ncbi:hypothetical protein ACHAXT_002164 [Thalassiosira profunda]
MIAHSPRAATPGRAFRSLTIFLAASATVHPGADAAKLTSLGSTVESGPGPNEPSASVNEENSVEDLSSLACAASYDDDSPSLATCADSYGVDTSFPVQHDVGVLPIGSGPREFYTDFMRGCRDKYHPRGNTCDGSENDRIEMNLRQPESMYNYTTLGFHKVRAPAHLMSLLTRFWDRKFTTLDAIRNETWDVGNTYTNHWASPTKMLYVDNRKAIWDATKPLLEEWTGVELSQTSLYGVRVYTEGAVLAPHVDRVPLVISAIVNVAQDLDEPWPLEVYGHDGRAYNITMEPGDMIFYESHSVIHGRPFPLKGRYYANVFIHFEPLGHTLRHEEQNGEGEESFEELYKQAWKRLQSRCDDEESCKRRQDLNVADEVPLYIVPGSAEEQRWIQTHPKARLDTTKDANWVKSLNAHTAASNGDLDALIAIAAESPAMIKHKDNNGWTPLHEAARGGHIDVVKFLLKSGLDKNERTHTGNGGSPLWWAKKTHGATHPMVQYLESIGAEEIPPKGHGKIGEDGEEMKEKKKK